MSEFEVNYRGSGIVVSEFVGRETTTQVRPYGMNSGWMYLHSGDRPWLTYHVQKVESIEISEQESATDSPHVWLNIETGYGEHLSIFLNGATLDMIADAIGCEQMVIQATEQEGLLA